MNARTENVRLTLIGPLPPPIHGQSVATTHMVHELTPRFPQMRVANTAEGTAQGWRGAMVKLRRAVASWLATLRADAVYIAVKADGGMWLTTVAAGLARLTGGRVFLHHHSYGYVSERTFRMVVLTRVAGPQAHHIVLSSTMGKQLKSVVPEVPEPLVVGNAGLIDKSLLTLPLKADGTDCVLGHVSDLSCEKGIGEVVDLAVALRNSGVRARLIVGGPDIGGESRRHRDRAAQELGELFEYRGLVSGESKRAFFQDITHFIFPSRYVHEAVPLVLYEALAAGALCVATRQGSIPEQLEGSPSLLTHSAETFVDEALAFIADGAASADISQECRQAYKASLSESEAQLVHLARLLAGEHTKTP